MIFGICVEKLLPLFKHSGLLHYNIVIISIYNYLIFIVQYYISFIFFLNINCLRTLILRFIKQLNVDKHF